ncbi:MAG: NADP-dependent oxidoreductase [Pseudomonadota bacterium]
MQFVALKTVIDHKPRAADFTVLDMNTPACPDDGVLVRVVYLSLDPYVGSRLRGRHMGEPAPAPGEDPIPGAIVGQVIESKSSSFSKGDWIHSMEGGWQEVAALKSDECRGVDPSVAPLSAHAGVLGMPGLTAWAGITQLAKVRDGDVVLVDAAAGPVGGTAGQIARLQGVNRVVGIAGGPVKCALVTEQYGFDACVDYKSDGWQDALKDALPNGLSVFFENVSADMAMVALGHAQLYARGVLCGLVDAYHTKTQSQHPVNIGLVIGKRAQLSGLVVYDFYPRWDEYVAEAASWISSGQLAFAEDRVEGLGSAPALFEKLMDGQHTGKAVVQVAEENI